MPCLIINFWLDGRRFSLLAFLMRDRESNLGASKKEAGKWVVFKFWIGYYCYIGYNGKKKIGKKSNNYATI